MYRESTHTVCAGCGSTLAYDHAELDREARYVCARCGARGRFDAALERWHGESRARRPFRILMGAAAVGAMVAMPQIALVAILCTVFAIGIVQGERRD